ncbi:MAG: thioredoxin family protein [Pirellulaceae bacterium]
MSRWLLSAFVLCSLFSSVGFSQSADPPPANWMERTDEGLKLLFTGKATNANGSAAVTRMQVLDRPDPLAEHPRIRDVQPHNGSFSFDSIGTGALVVWAANEGGTQQALEMIAAQDVASAARSGIEVQMEPAHLLAVRVLNQQQPVTDAQVLVQLACGLEIDGRTGKDGIARIYFPNGQLPSYIRAWTAEKKIGSVDFRNSSDITRKKTLHTVELIECKPLTVRVVDERGTPQSDLPIRLGVSDSKSEWMIDSGLFETVSDQNGEATFDYFPNWEDERHFLNADVSDRFIERKPEVIDGVNVYTLRAYEPALKTKFQMSLPERCPSGLLIEGYSFQSNRESRATLFSSRVDSEGRFEAPIVPGYTYHLSINDDQWVSKPLSQILVDGESHQPLPLDFVIVRGTDITVRLTAGRNHTPLAGKTTNLTTPHDFQWKEEDGETHHGSGGRLWHAVTDSEGIVHTRAYPGEFEVRSYFGSSMLEKTFEIKAEGNNEFEIHRELAGSAYVNGLLTSKDPSAVLEDAEIFIGSAESSSLKTSVAGIAAADGKFDAQVDAARGYAYAVTTDENYSGAAKFTTSEGKIEIEMLKVGQVGGQVLDDQGIPIEGRKVYVSATIRPFEKPDDVGDNWPMSINIVRLETKTDKDGKFLFEQLPTQVGVRIILDMQHIERGRVRHLDEVFLKPGESRLDNVYRPKAKKNENIEDLFSKLLRSCQCMHTHGLVLVGGNAKAVEKLRHEALDYDEHADVLWFLPFLIDVTADGENAAANLEDKRKLLERRNWTLPSESELLLVAVDWEGNELGQLVLSAELPAHSASQSIAEFLAQHRIEQQDARQKLSDALAEAKSSGRRVWACVGGTRCGPCISMANWLEDHRSFIEKAFVLVEIDALRDLYGQEVAEQLKQHGGIPWHVMLDDAGEILVTSEAPIGNIGSPDPSPESLEHMRQMFTAAASDLLTPEEINVLLETIK